MVLMLELESTLSQHPAPETPPFGPLALLILLWPVDSGVPHPVPWNMLVLSFPSLYK